MIQFVYWIHNPQMTDPSTQGYVGVTNNLKRRITNHLSKLRNEHHDNQHFQRAFNLDDDLVVDILFEGDEEQCYLLEHQLRPKQNVGWNINVGGTKPPSAHGKQHALGNKGPTKPLISPDGIIFESRKDAAKYYNVDISTIHNWLKDPTKVWGKRSSNKQHLKHDIRLESLKRQRPIMTPRGRFDSIKMASIAFGVVHGTINYWLKTKPTKFYYLIDDE